MRILSKKPSFTIICDTREQLSYDFKLYGQKVIWKGIKTGDYSCMTETEDYSISGICIERKSHADCYSSLGGGRERLESEFQRMSQFQYAAFVVEAGFIDINPFKDEIRKRLSSIEALSDMSTYQNRINNALNEIRTLLRSIQTNSILTPPEMSQMSPRSVVNSLLSWSQKYNVHVFFGGDRKHSEAIVYNLLEKFVINQNRKNERKESVAA